MAKKRTKCGNLPAKTTSKDASPVKLLADIRELIESTRTGVAQAANSALVILCWQVASRIQMNVRHNRRAGHGEKILPTLCASHLRNRLLVHSRQRDNRSGIGSWSSMDAKVPHAGSVENYGNEAPFQAHLLGKRTYRTAACGLGVSAPSPKSATGPPPV